ncbi:MAG: hypothetical protein SP4CHLAM5_10130 [Chlamydiia bacterium]|nr:hypothetical protein [Chlamydiia bacterium]MCH9623969.1 hypothetical protein [Chlamydiia bacterium]
MVFQRGILKQIQSQNPTIKGNLSLDTLLVITHIFSFWRDFSLDHLSFQFQQKNTTVITTVSSLKEAFPNVNIYEWQDLYQSIYTSHVIDKDWALTQINGLRNAWNHRNDDDIEMDTLWPVFHLKSH